MKNIVILTEYYINIIGRGVLDFTVSTDCHVFRKIGQANQYEWIWIMFDKLENLEHCIVVDEYDICFSSFYI